MKCDTKNNVRTVFLMIVLLLPFISGCSNMQTPDLDTMITNLKENIQPLIYLTGAIGYVMGFFFVAAGIRDFKVIGEAHGGAGGAGVSGAIIKIIVGSALVFLPSVIETGTMTFWKLPHEDPFFKYTTTSVEPWDPVMQASILLLELLGYISVIRGFVTLNRIHNQGQQATLGKALIFIISGILAINIVGLTKIMANSLGFIIS